MGTSQQAVKNVLTNMREKAGMGTVLEFVLWLLNDYDALTEIYELDWREDRVGRSLFRVEDETSRVRPHATTAAGV